MTAYRVTLLDCDLCGTVYDPGPYGIHETFAKVRRMASREATDWSAEGHAWRSWRNVDICPKHHEMTMPQAIDAAELRRNGGATPTREDPS